MTDIHENLPSLHFLWFTHFDWGIIAIFLVIFCFYIWKFFFAKKQILVEKIKPKEIFKPKKFSFASNLRKLYSLQKKEEWKKFVLLATEILKKILEKKYQKPFLFATGKEIQEILEQKGITQIQKEIIQELFQLINPVKFADKKAKIETTKTIIMFLKKIQKSFS